MCPAITLSLVRVSVGRLPWMSCIFIKVDSKLMRWQRNKMQILVENTLSIKDIQAWHLSPTFHHMKRNMFFLTDILSESVMLLLPLFCFPHRQIVIYVSSFRPWLLRLDWVWCPLVCFACCLGHLRWLCMPLYPLVCSIVVWLILMLLHIDFFIHSVLTMFKERDNFSFKHIY